MKAVAAIVILAIGLGGCATTGGVSGPPTPTQISDVAKQIQSYTKTACSFIPTIQTIVSIINAGAGSAFGIASDICQAVTTAPLADGGPRIVKVSGVTVHGKFVK